MEVVNIIYILAFIAVFMFVVIIHEFGHFLFAKIFGVDVLEFAIGFGPVLYKKKIGRTLLRINLIPFGGYVKLKGEQLDEEGENSLYSKPAWQRLLIAFAGPLFSILAAYILFIPIVSIWGVPAVTVGKVMENSPAQIAGLQDGDVILKINGKRVFDSAEVSEIISKGEVVKLTVLRNNEKMDLTITPKLSPPEYIFVLDDVSGKIEGKISKINGYLIGTDLKLNAGQFVEIVDEFGNTLSGAVVSYSFVPERYTIGFYYAGLKPVITKDFSPFKKGDRLVKVNDLEIVDYFSIVRLATAMGLSKDQAYVDIWGEKLNDFILPFDENLTIQIIRDNELHTFQMVKEEFYKIITEPGIFESENYVLKPANFIETISLAVQRCNSAAVIIWKAFQKLFFTGQGVQNVAGPIGIAVIIGDAAKAGWEMMLTVVAFFTLNLGIFNLLPLPALDGGRIIFSLIEIILRRKIDRRIEAIIHTIGFFILMILLFYFMFADITRFF
ncbi:MAG: regulator of sigma protease [Thermosipho sp. (in: thermotogales)]|nr:regulator of sigma protease [Thermosipho sp. (in: thermotogales)]